MTPQSKTPEVNQPTVKTTGSPPPRIGVVLSLWDGFWDDSRSGVKTEAGKDHLTACEAPGSQEWINWTVTLPSLPVWSLKFLTGSIGWASRRLVGRHERWTLGTGTLDGLGVRDGLRERSPAARAARAAPGGGTPIPV